MLDEISEKNWSSKKEIKIKKGSIQFFEDIVKKFFSLAANDAI